MRSRRKVGSAPFLMHRTTAPNLTSILFALAAGVLIPVVFLLSADAAIEPPYAVAVIGILVYAAVHLAVLISSGEKRPIQGIFWLFSYVTLGVAPLAQIVTGQSQRVMEANFLPLAYGLIAAGFLSYDIGSLLAKRQSRSSEVLSYTPKRALSLQRLRFVSFAALLLSVSLIAQRGVASYFTSRQEGVEFLEAAAGEGDGQAARALLSSLGSVPQVVLLLCWVLVHVQLRRSGRAGSIESVVWISVYAVLTFITTNFWTSSRFWLLTVVVAVYFAIPWVRASLFRLALVIGALGAVLLFPLSDVFRLSSEYRAMYGFANQGIIQNLAVKDYDQLVMITNGLWYVARSGFHYGEQMLGNLLFWVPRSIWPGKPIDTGVEIGQAMLASNVNLSSPLWIELYVDGGWGLVVIGFALLGYASTRADNYFIQANSSPMYFIRIGQVLVPLIAGYQFILLRGPLLQSMGRLAVIIGLVWFLFGHRRRTPRQRVIRSRKIRVPA